VIAITAQDYSEAAASHIDAKDSPQTHDENQQDFSEILSGLLNIQSDQPITIENIIPETLIPDIELLSINVIPEENLDSFEFNQAEIKYTGFEQTELKESFIVENPQEILSDEQAAIQAAMAAEKLAAKLETKTETSPRQNIAADSGVIQSTDTGKKIQPEKLPVVENTEMASLAKKIVSTKAETESGSREDRGNNTEDLRSRGKIAIELRDQRTRAVTAKVSAANTSAAAGTMAGTAMAGQSFVFSDAAGRTADVKDITLELKLPEFNNAGQSAQTTWEVKAPQINFESALENMLARELHNNFNGDIVRHASMALRDSGESIIRLNLRPESLGNVKIHLQMTDNKITGFIIVESEEALNAFRKEITSLEQAFKDAGFSETNLDLSLAGQGGNARDEAEFDDPNAVKTAASSYEEYLSVNEAVVSIFGQRAGAVSVLA